MFGLRDGRNNATDNVVRMIPEEVRQIGSPDERRFAGAELGVLGTGPSQRPRPSVMPVRQRIEHAVENPATIYLCDDVGMDRCALVGVTGKPSRNKTIGASRRNVVAPSHRVPSDIPPPPPTASGHFRLAVELAQKLVPVKS